MNKKKILNVAKGIGNVVGLIFALFFKFGMGIIEMFEVEPKQKKTKHKKRKKKK